MIRLTDLDAPKYAERLGALAWLALGGATASLALVVMYVGSVAAPYWDQWNFVDPEFYLARIFHRHNEHPIVLGRIFFAIDYYLFDARGWWLQSLTFLTLAVEAAAFTWLARASGFRSVPLTAIAAGFAATALFNPHIWENLVWGFQVPFVLAFSSTVVAAAALARYAETGGRLNLIVTLACAIIAPLSLSNGLLTPVLLAGMAWVLRLRWKVIFTLAGISALVWLMYLLSPSLPHTPDAPGIFEFPYVKWASYFLYFLGGGAANSLDYMSPFIGPLPFERLSAAFFIGLAMVAASTWMLAHVLFDSRRTPADVALSLIVCFLVATAALSAYGRISFDVAQALSSRYGVVGGALAVALTIWFAKTLVSQPEHRWRLGALILASAMVSAIVPLASLMLVKNLTGQQQLRTSAIPAMVVDAPDGERIGSLSYNMDMSREASAKLKAAGKWHFQSYWAQHMGEVSPRDIASDRICAGDAGIDSTWTDETSARISGHIIRRDAAKGRIVLATDSTNRLVGYALVPQRASDLIPAQDGYAQLAWTGNIRLDLSPPPYEFYLATQSSIVCKFPAEPAPAPN